MDQILHQQNIVDYYYQCNNAYRDAWKLDRNMQLNLGLWKKGTKNLAQALHNLNKEIAEKASIGKESIILDAGCGVGGTAIHFAKTYSCRVIGITLSPLQAEKAKENALKFGVGELCTFHVMDYMNTSFENDYFDLIVGIESICYAEPKIDFLKEAYRLLKPGGRIILAENLQARSELSPKEFDSLYTNAFHGCRVQSLDTEEQYLENLNQLDYKDSLCEDYTDMIYPSIRRLRRFYYPAKLYNLYHRMIGKPFSEIQEANTRMCFHLLSSLNNGLWKYGIISARK